MSGRINTVDDSDCVGDPAGPLCDAGRCTTTCLPGDSKSCYTGPLDKVDVGACVRGTSTCAEDGLSWGVCTGEVLPLASEVCGNTVDDDCNGEVDEDIDADGDGWGVCSGDCCDTEGGECFDPEKVNPGAYEYVGNRVDDNCDAAIDEVAAACDGGLASDSSDAKDYARALDLCTFTTESPQDPEGSGVGCHLGQAAALEQRLQELTSQLVALPGLDSVTSGSHLVSA